MKNYKEQFKNVWDRKDELKEHLIFGKNSKESSIQMALLDVDRASTFANIISSQFRNDYWQGDIEKLLIQKSEEGVKLHLIGGPHMLDENADNDIVLGLDRDGILELSIVPENPSLGMRNIDDQLLFVAEANEEVHGSLSERRYLRAETPQDDLKQLTDAMFSEYSAQSVRFFHPVHKDNISETAVQSVLDNLDKFEPETASAIHKYLHS